MRAAAPTLLAAATLALAGCATAGLRPPSSVVERAAVARSYSGRLRVTLRGPDLRGRTAVLLGFRRPGALRIEIPGPAGARLLAVARDDELVAVFPSERAVFRGPATAAGLFDLLGIALSPAEVMDLLLGTPSPRVRDYRARWGPALPRELRATLPDGGRLKATVETATLDADLPEEAFAEPPHEGYRAIDAAEARRLWGAR